MTLDYMIRSYQPKDQEAVRNICADTGFLGDPIDPIFSDREIFADIFTNYYLEKEPEHSFIAEVDNQVVGYLMASLNKNPKSALILNSLSPGIRASYNQLTGKYQKSPQNKEFIDWLFFRVSKEIPKNPTAAMHAHFNVRKDYRNEGIGKSLMWTMFENLKSKAFERDIDKLYLEIFSDGQKDEQYFKDINFKLHDKKKSTLFRNQFNKEIELLCVWQYLDRLHPKTL
ncbi:GNAT family N-acetyltransferase [archaeon]|jgi:predicted N-acetyltransferase YhbS|nr:GNAT family N-acetyltransferase [archaeon]MBT3451625.1 GNAT family N-acetyltransferase [archaeon]MBT6869646.1 GNAT family N-acetyltransferase [archaeon]MBT7192414.1 GNAT family N-acetyltransferase [archaeon]MBT7380215.1 GNAT family N-acetyltransferase [archaeon]